MRSCLPLKVRNSYPISTLGWSFGVVWVVLIVLSSILGVHINTTATETEEYVKTGRIRIRLGIAMVLAFASVVAVIVGGGVNEDHHLTETDPSYWSDLVPWFILSVIGGTWWIAYLNHLYRVVRAEEAGVLTAVDGALKIKFPVTQEQLQQLESQFK